jgi:hypothetical protein
VFSIFSVVNGGFQEDGSEERARGPASGAASRIPAGQGDDEVFEARLMRTASVSFMLPVR